MTLARVLADGLEDAIAGCAERLPLLGHMTQRLWRCLTPYVVSGLVLPTGVPAGGGGGMRAPHHVSFCVRGAHRRDLVTQFEGHGVLLSGGSACSTDSGLPSHVLAACGVPGPFIHAPGPTCGRPRAPGSVRITLSHTNTMQEIEEVVCPALEPAFPFRRARRGQRVLREAADRLSEGD